ncbi:redoxin domain-containing protein [Allosphingosinicella flava]|nr:redoxin domain-containing protein [Sphingosinicella flava]
MLTTGSCCPEARFRTSSGSWIRLKDFRGQKLILFFCPADEAECVSEIEDFALLARSFSRCGAWIMGVLPNRVGARRLMQGSDIKLVEDAERSASTCFSVWLNGGAPARGTAPATFFYDRDGRLCHIWRNAPLSGHASKVLEAAESFK